MYREGSGKVEKEEILDKGKEVRKSEKYSKKNSEYLEYFWIYMLIESEGIISKNIWNFLCLERLIQSGRKR